MQGKGYLRPTEKRRVFMYPFIRGGGRNSGAIATEGDHCLMGTTDGVLNGVDS